MKILGLETSSKICSLALAQDESILLEYNLNLGLKHSELLLPLIDQALKIVSWRINDLEGIVVDRGPGSFTGLRIGLTTARTLAQGLNIPLVGVISLDVLARKVYPREEFYLSSLLDALGGEIYTTLYSPQGATWRRLQPYQVIKIDQWLIYLYSLKKNIFFIGEGSQVYQQKIKKILKQFAFFPFDSRYPTADAVIYLGRKKLLSREKNPSPIIPLYLRRSYAEINLTPSRCSSGRSHPDPESRRNAGMKGKGLIFI